MLAHVEEGRIAHPGTIDAPFLRIEGDAWTVTPPGAASRRYTTSDLALALRKSRPWGEPSGDPPA